MFPEAESKQNKKHMKKTNLLFAILLALFSITEVQTAFAFTVGDAVVAYNPGNKTLGFLVINSRQELQLLERLVSEQGGSLYPLNTGENNPGWLEHNDDIVKVIFDSSFANYTPTSTFHWFFGMSKLTSIENLSNLNTSKVRTMAGMFHQCSSLTSLNLSDFDTSRVTSMRYMFYGMKNMTRVNISSFVTTNVTDMSGMFFDCRSLTSLNLSNFNTSNVERMDYMFDSCYKLTSLNLSNFNTSKVKNMCCMFRHMNSLTSLDLSNFDTSNVTDMSYMFNGSYSLTNLKLYEYEMNLGEYAEYSSSFSTANVTNMDYMFTSCRSLTELVLPNSFTLASGVTTEEMFVDCTALEDLYLGNDMSAVHSSAFNGVGTPSSPCSLTSPRYDPEATQYTASYMVWKKGYFTDALRRPFVKYSNETLTFEYGIRMLDGNYNLPPDGESPDWLEHAENVKKVVFEQKFQKVFPTSTAYWFNHMVNLTSIEGLEYLNTNEVTSMTHMFDECSSLKSLDVSHFNTENATDMSCMFAYLSAIDSLDLRSFVFTTETNTAHFLEGCRVKQLQIPLSAKNLNQTACKYVGSYNNLALPCILIYPDDFDFEGVDTYHDSFMWKGGCFGEGLPFVVYNNSKITFYYGNKYRFDAGSGGSIYDLNKIDEGYEMPQWVQNHGPIIETAVFDSSFRRARPITTANWFYDMRELTSIQGIENLITQKTVNMSWMFYSCWGLTTLDLRYFDTSAAQDLSHMLDRCNKIRVLDLSSFVINNNANLNSMLRNVRGLKQLIVSASIVECTNTTRTDMFYNVGTIAKPCQLALPQNSTLNSDEVRNYDGYFRWRQGYFTDYHEPYAVYDQNKLTFYCDGNLSQWEAQGVTVMNLPNNDWAMPRWYSEQDIRLGIKEVVFDESFSNTFPSSTFFWFAQMNQATFSGWKNFNTDRLHTTQFMFYMSNVKSLDLSDFNTPQTVMMESMFTYCTELEDITLPAKFVTPNTTRIYSMFQECTKLKKLDLSDFNIQIEDASLTAYLLSNCESLRELTISENLVNLSDDACRGVGTETNPCLLNVPEGVTLDTTEGPGYFIWKEGYFMSPSDILIGDANGDKSVSVADVTLVVAYVKNGPQDDFHFRNADANGDGEISVGDVTEIVNIIVGNQ